MSFNFMAAVTIYSDFGVQKIIIIIIKSLTVSIVSPSISCEVMGPEAMVLVFLKLSFKPTFSLSSHFHQEPLYFFFTFCYKGGVICISEIIDISPSSLDSSLCFRNYGPCHVGPPKMDWSWWRVLKKCGPVVKGMANHFTILALRIP